MNKITITEDVNSIKPICRSCGKEFTSSFSNQINCKECLKEFKEIESNLLQKESSRFIRHCKYCGRPFNAKMIRTMNGKSVEQLSKKAYCDGINNNVHYTQCESCNKGFAFTITSSHFFPKTCSENCRETLKSVKRVNTNLRRYGYASTTQVPEFKEKSKNSILQKYGCTNVMKNSQIRQKADLTVKERYGVDNVSQCPVIREKINSTVEKTGGYTLKSPISKAKYEKTMLERYGTINPQEIETTKVKTAQTSLAKYGVTNVMKAPDIVRDIQLQAIYRHAETITDEQKRKQYIEFKTSPKEYLEKFETKPTASYLMDSLGYSDFTTIYQIIDKENLKELVEFHISLMEGEVIDFLVSVDPNIKILKRDRKIISPYELDIYLPDYNLAIECNPTITHNSTKILGNWFKEGSKKPLTRNYHKMKSDLCAEKGIFLFHIFGYEWTNNSNIIKSMIKNLLGKCDKRYYARNLTVRPIDSSSCKRFLNENHRQGSVNAKVRLGLFKEDELISIMTFNRMRSTMGSTHNDTDDTWELSRFCSKLNTSVVGGASKFFKYFTENYKFDKIVSFSDVAHTKGTVYDKLGFSCVKHCSPCYIWVNLKTDSYLTRANTRKSNIRKLFNDLDIDIDNKTEAQILSEHGYVQVYDSGLKRWEYLK